MQWRRVECAHVDKVGECTWNHLACRRAASASKHFCRGRTSLSSRFMSPPSSDNTKGVWPSKLRRKRGKHRRAGARGGGAHGTMDIHSLSGKQRIELAVDQNEARIQSSVWSNKSTARIPGCKARLDSYFNNKQIQDCCCYFGGTKMSIEYESSLLYYFWNTNQKAVYVVKNKCP